MNKDRRTEQATFHSEIGNRLDKQAMLNKAAFFLASLSGALFYIDQKELAAVAGAAAILTFLGKFNIKAENKIKGKFLK